MRIYFRVISNIHETLGVEGYLEINECTDEIQYYYYNENGETSTNVSFIDYEADMNRLTHEQKIRLDEFHHHFHEQESWITDSLINYCPCAVNSVQSMGDISLLIDEVE